MVHRQLHDRREREAERLDDQPVPVGEKPFHRGGPPAPEPLVARALVEPEEALEESAVAFLGHFREDPVVADALEEVRHRLRREPPVHHLEGGEVEDRGLALGEVGALAERVGERRLRVLPEDAHEVRGLLEGPRRHEAVDLVAGDGGGPLLALRGEPADPVRDGVHDALADPLLHQRLAAEDEVDLLRHVAPELLHGLGDEAVRREGLEDPGGERAEPAAGVFGNVLDEAGPERDGPRVVHEVPVTRLQGLGLRGELAADREVEAVPGHRGNDRPRHGLRAELQGAADGGLDEARPERLLEGVHLPAEDRAVPGERADSAEHRGLPAERAVERALAEEAGEPLHPVDEAASRVLHLEALLRAGGHDLHDLRGERAVLGRRAAERAEDRGVDGLGPRALPERAGRRGADERLGDLVHDGLELAFAGELRRLLADDAAESLGPAGRAGERQEPVLERRVEAVVEDVGGVAVDQQEPREVRVHRAVVRLAVGVREVLGGLEALALRDLRLRGMAERVLAEHLGSRGRDVAPLLLEHLPAHRLEGVRATLGDRGPGEVPLREPGELRRRVQDRRALAAGEALLDGAFGELAERVRRDLRAAPAEHLGEDPAASAEEKGSCAADDGADGRADGPSDEGSDRRARLGAAGDKGGRRRYLGHERERAPDHGADLVARGALGVYLLLEHETAHGEGLVVRHGLAVLHLLHGLRHRDRVADGGADVHEPADERDVPEVPVGEARKEAG